MTEESGHTATGARGAEIAGYVEEVWEALRDLPLSQRDDLLEDLPAHLAEVVAEDPAPLRERLGEPYPCPHLRRCLRPRAEGRALRAGRATTDTMEINSG
jgi:hypothetical protein